MLQNIFTLSCLFLLAIFAQQKTLSNNVKYCLNYLTFIYIFAIMVTLHEYSDSIM